MGCMWSNPPATETNGQSDIEEKKHYSWDKREKTSQTEYTIENRKGETICRHPGTVDGQPVTILKCQNCKIYIFDNSASVNIDDCVDCKLFIGPVRTSANFRSCHRCAVIVSCQQFAANNCDNVDILLCVSSKPVIDSCTEMRFGCYSYFYPLLDDQFNHAQLSIFNNSWSDVCDTSTVKHVNSFRLISEDVKVDTLVPFVDGCRTVGVSTECCRSVVPFTPAVKLAPSDVSLCVVMFFSDGLSHERARTFIRQMESNHPKCRLMQCREQTMEEEVAVTMFGTDKYALAVKQGAVIALVYSGENCCELCQAMLVEVSCGSTGLVAVSSGPEVAARQVDTFFCSDIPRLAPSSSVRLRHR